MKKIFSLFAVVFGVFALATVAHAESITGTIVAVNSDDKSVTIAPSDRSAGLPQELNLSVQDEKAYKDKGIQSLDELAVGDEIRVEAERQDTGDWEVQSLEKNTEAGAGAAAGDAATADTAGQAGEQAPMTGGAR
jgi:hypothetical protein